MEATRAEKTRLGLFILVMIAGFVVSVIFLIGGVFTAKTVTYFTRLEEPVTGLEPGTPVKQNGVDIGQVSSITTDSSDIQKTVVRFRVKAGTPMKTDMVATLGNYGITGLKYLEITGGSYASTDLPPGGEVKSRLSLLGGFALRADSIAVKIDHLLGNAIEITQAQNRNHLDQLMASSASLSASLDSLARDLHKIRPGERVDRLLSSAAATVDDLHRQIRQADLPGTLKEYRTAAQDMQTVAQHLDVTVRRSQEDLGVALSNLKEALKNVNSFSRQIKENPSVLLRGEDKQERRE